MPAPQPVALLVAFGCCALAPAAAASSSPPFGTAWVRSDAAEVELAVVQDDRHGTALRWTKPKKPTVLLTYLDKPLPLATMGDVAAVRFDWRSDGVNKCDPFDWVGPPTLLSTSQLLAASACQLEPAGAGAGRRPAPPVLRCLQRVSAFERRPFVWWCVARAGRRQELRLQARHQRTM